MKFKLITILTLTGLIILFILQNFAIVEIQFLFWSLQMSRPLLIFSLLASGIIIGWFLHSYLIHRQIKRSSNEKPDK
jgi:uncharacterized integral membrane protein